MTFTETLPVIANLRGSSRLKKRTEAAVAFKNPLLFREMHLQVGGCQSGYSAAVLKGLWGLKLYEKYKLETATEHTVNI